MKVYVNARHWNETHEDTFGLAGSVFDLPNESEAALRKLAVFGRFSISFIDDGLPTIVFENEYDDVVVHPDAHLSPVEFAKKHFRKNTTKVKRGQRKNR